MKKCKDKLHKFKFDTIDVNHQEALAYLAGYIAECCGKVKNYKPKKKKNV